MMADPATARRHPAVTSSRGFFWVGVEPARTAAGTVPGAPMYVEWEEPAEVRHPYPIVLVHGGGGQGTDWLGTPDGRPGWANLLVADGWKVYVVDRPGHGRASAGGAQLGERTPRLPYEATGLFTASAPGLPDHTQWPGSGEPGADGALDQFVASCGPMVADQPTGQDADGRCGAALLDAIGPAVVVTHSAGAPAGWLMADRRPGSVKALIALEPLGPAFAVIPELGIDLVWGLTSVPLEYEPSVPDPASLRDGATRRLTNLAEVPVAVVAAPASPLGAATGPIVDFLRARGCDADLVALADSGLLGNGHAMMLERNSHEVLRVVLDWLTRRGITSAR